MRTLARETPFVMTYDNQTMIPLEIGMPSYRAQEYCEKLNDRGLVGNLDLLKENREEVGVRNYRKITA